MNFLKLKTQAAIIFTFSFAMIFSQTAHADTTLLAPYSWDPGLYATVDRYNDTAHAWGRRASAGAWGTGSVNYQAGPTTNWRGSSSGTLNVVLKGTYCPGGQCSYGSGSGYKGLVQLWNDPNNFVAFGLIHDPGVSPTGTTLMIEGAAGGKPIGGYWGNNGITGASHLLTINWGPSGISVTVDHNVTLGPYPVAANNPSISFLSAARNTGDIVDTTFSGINFSSGSVNADPIVEPASAPYVTYSANLTENGSGTGYSSYINVHDANNNALAVGIQSDTGAPESRGAPMYIWERVQNGQFTYQYLSAASHSSTPVTLKWWKGEDTAIFYINGQPLSQISMHLDPRLFFNAEGNARLNGDSVNSQVNNTQITVGDTCPTYCGLNGVWNTSNFNFHGLTATRTNGNTQNGANFTISGTVNGLAPGHDWDSDLVAGIGMIAQYWNGQ
jgi:hypothetical protein